MRTARLAAAALLTLVLVGCNGDNPKPAPLPTATSSSPTPIETPPTYPASATGASSGAAKAFVHHWIDVFNYASATGDTDGLRAISSPLCQTCEAIITKIDATYSAGGYTKSDGWAVNRLRLVTPANITGAIVTQPQEVLEQQGGKVENYPGERFKARFSLDMQQRQWLMLRFVRR